MAASDSTSIFRVAKTGAVKEMKQLLYEDNDITANVVANGSQNLLFFAVQNLSCAVDMCKMLIEEYEVDPFSLDIARQSPLHYLAKMPNEDCLKYLLDKKCAASECDTRNQTPLFYAAKSGQVGMIHILCTAGANANHKDASKQTPAFYAANYATCNALAAHGADFSLKDIHKRTPADYFGTYISGGGGSFKPDLAKVMRSHACTASMNRRLVWKVCEDGNGYAVFLARPGDLTALSVLEDEYLQDMQNYFAEISSEPTEEEKRNCVDELGLSEDPASRQEDVFQVLQQQHRAGNKVLAYTLVCICTPGSLFEEDAEEDLVPKAAVVGYIHCQHLLPGEDDGANAKEELVISHLKVSNSCQRQGVGTMLVTGALKQAEKSNRLSMTTEIKLSVLTKNKPALTFCNKLNFKKETCESTNATWRTLARPCGPGMFESWIELVPGAIAASFGAKVGRKTTEPKRHAGAKVTRPTPRVPLKKPPAEETSTRKRQLDPSTDLTETEKRSRRFSERGSATHRGKAAYARVVGPTVVGQDAQKTSSQRKGQGSSNLDSPEEVSVWEIQVDTTKLFFGAQTEPSPSTDSRVINKVLEGGNLDAWNKRFPSQAVTEGDHIINATTVDEPFPKKGVNASSITEMFLAHAHGRPQVLKLLISRPSENGQARSKHCEVQESHFNSLRGKIAKIAKTSQDNYGGEESSSNSRSNVSGIRDRCGRHSSGPPSDVSV